MHNGKHFSHSPYSYTFCNPIIYNDPDGRSPRLSLLRKLNNAERRLILQSSRNLRAAIKISNNTSIALEQAQSFAREQAGGNRMEANQSLNEGEAKAFRHAFYSAMNGRDVGVSLARQYGEAHEAFDNNPFEAMDLSNNEVGFQIIIENPNATNEEIYNLVIEALDEGRLVTNREEADPQMNRAEEYYVPNSHIEDPNKHREY